MRAVGVLALGILFAACARAQAPIPAVTDRIGLKGFWLGMTATEVRAVSSDAACDTSSCRINLPAGQTFAGLPSHEALLMLAEDGRVYAITFYLDGSTWGDVCAAVREHPIFGGWPPQKQEDGCAHESANRRFSLYAIKTVEGLIEVSLIDGRPAEIEAKRRDVKRAKDM